MKYVKTEFVQNDLRHFLSLYHKNILCNLMEELLGKWPSINQYKKNDNMIYKTFYLFYKVKDLMSQKAARKVITEFKKLKFYKKSLEWLH